MVNIDATTPQLKVVKTWLEAYNTLNVDHVEPFISKNFVCKTFPKSSLTPDEGKARHLEKFAGIAAICAKTETIIEDLIEAPGRVVFHATWKCTTVNGASLTYEIVCILTLVEEDGKLKIGEMKDFSGPQDRDAFYTGVSESLALSKGLAAS